MQIPENTKKRVVEDELQIDGRTFKVTSFDPLLGNYIMVQLFTMVLPFGIGDALKSAMPNTESIPTVNTPDAKVMGKAEFLELQRDILSNCYEILPAGQAPVVRQNGTYGIENFTMSIALQLLIACVAFNFSDFFAAGQLGGLPIFPQDSSSASTQTSTQTSTPQ